MTPMNSNLKSIKVIVKPLDYYWHLNLFLIGAIMEEVVYKILIHHT
jgi:hypothetical protein